MSSSIVKTKRMFCISCGYDFNYKKPLEELKECPKCQANAKINLTEMKM